MIHFQLLMHFISNRITSILNGEKASLRHIVYNIPKSRHYKNTFTILTILRDAGIIRAYSFISDKADNKFIIYLKYDSVGNSVVSAMHRVSKPSRTIYVSTKAL